jgi:hypothetical protein
VEVNFEAKTWECAVNGRPALSGLRFHSNDVVGFGSVDLASSERDVVLDQLTVSGSNPPPSEGTDRVAGVPLAMGFEPQEGYALGDLDTQKGWEVDVGQAEVWTQTVHSGLQAARIAPGGRVSHRFATGLPKTTFSTYLQATPSSAPEIPSAGQAAVFVSGSRPGIDLFGWRWERGRSLGGQRGERPCRRLVPADAQPGFRIEDVGVPGQWPARLVRTAFPCEPRHGLWFRRGGVRQRGHPSGLGASGCFDRSNRSQPPTRPGFHLSVRLGL